MAMHRRWRRSGFSAFTFAACAIGVVMTPAVAVAQNRPATSASSPGPATGPEVIDRMMAVVAGDLIMMSDVTAAVEFGLVPSATAGDVTRTVLSQLIDRSLMLAEVERYAPPEPSAAAVDREYQAVQQRFSSETAFADALARYGISESALRATLRANLRLRAYLEQRFTTVPPSDEEIAAYYQAHQERFARAGQPLPLADVRADVIQALGLDRRQSMVEEWLTGLRRRVSITDVYLPAAVPLPQR